MLAESKNAKLSAVEVIPSVPMKTYFVTFRGDRVTFRQVVASLNGMAYANGMVVVPFNVDMDQIRELLQSGEHGVFIEDWSATRMGAPA
jgi:hypothetical protein